MFMRFLVHVITCLSVLAMGLLSFESYAATLETCIGQMCIGEKAPTFNKVKAGLGSVRRARIAGIDSERTICVYDLLTNTSKILSFSGDITVGKARLDGIFIARGMLCEGKASSSQQKIGVLRGHRDIQLGLPKDRLLEILGNPTRVDDAVAREKRDPRYLDTRYGSKYGIARLHYDAGDSSLLFNQFGIDSSGQVVSIWLNDSP